MQAHTSQPPPPAKGPAHGINPGNWTEAALVGGKCSITTAPYLLPASFNYCKIIRTFKSNNFIIPLYCCDSKSNFCAGFFFALKWNKLQWAEYLVESMTCNICLWCQYASLVSICMCGKCNGCAFINKCNKTNCILKKPTVQSSFMWTVCNVKGTQTVVLSSISFKMQVEYNDDQWQFLIT